MTDRLSQRMYGLAAGAILLLVCGSPARSQPVVPTSGAAGPPKSEPRAHVDHEGNPLPAEAITRLGSSRLRADGPIVWLACTLDGKTIVSASGDRASKKGAIQFWDAATGKLRTGKSAKMGDNAAGMAFHPDGKILHFDGEGFYRVLSPTDGSEISRVRLTPAGMPSSVWISVCFSPRGTLLALRSASDQVRLFDLVEGKELPPLKLQAAPPGGGVFVGPTLAFTPDGATLAVASEDNRLETFDVAHGFKKHIELEVPLKRVYHLNFSPDGKDVFCGGVGSESVLLRDWLGRKEIIRLDKSSGPIGVAFSPDGRRLAVANGNLAKLFDVASGNRLHQFSAGQYAPQVSFTPDGRTLLTGSAACAIGQWDTKTGLPLPASADPPGYVSLVRFTPAGKHLIARTDRHLLYDCTSGRMLRPCSAAESDYLFEARLSNDDAVLAVSRLKEVLLFDAKTGQELRRLGANGAYMGGASFRGNRLFVPCSDGVTRVWDANGMGASRSLKDPNPVSGVPWISTHGEYLAFAPFGRQDAANSGIRLWNVTAEKIIRRIVPPRQGAVHAMAFSTDGRLLAIEEAGSPGKFVPIVNVMDLRSGRTLPFAATLPSVGPLAFSPDARMLVTGDFDGEGLRLWEIATGKQRWQFRGHKTGIGSMVWSADGALLASSSNEAPAYIWDVFGTHAHERPVPVPWTADQKQKLWEDLIGADAKAGFEAIRTLVQSPGSATALLHSRLKLAEPVAAKKMKQLLRDLEGDDFDGRQRASAELQKLGDRIEGHLLHALNERPSLEAQRRLESLIESLEPGSPERLAQGRAMEALEQIATPEAVRLLEALAGGEPGARLTREATATLDRVRQRPK